MSRTIVSAIKGRSLNTSTALICQRSYKTSIWPEIRLKKELIIEPVNLRNKEHYVSRGIIREADL
jgi:hypothetical protein